MGIGRKHGLPVVLQSDKGLHRLDALDLHDAPTKSFLTQFRTQNRCALLLELL